MHKSFFCFLYFGHTVNCHIAVICVFVRTIEYYVLCMQDLNSFLNLFLLGPRITHP